MFGSENRSSMHSIRESACANETTAMEFNFTENSTPLQVLSCAVYEIFGRGPEVATRVVLSKSCP